MEQWISVKRQLPNKYVPVVVSDNAGHIVKRVGYLQQYWQYESGYRELIKPEHKWKSALDTSKK